MWFSSGDSLKVNTLFFPRSPYGVVKLYYFRIIENYRETYDIFEKIELFIEMQREFG